MFKWVPFILWCVLIFYLSHRPVPQPLTEAETFQGIDILYHFIVYGVLGFLFYRVYPSFTATFLFCLLYGLSDELHQAILPYRSFEWKDLGVDVISGITGGGVRWKFFK
ncbi:MAG: VanZ family protein [Deltaproteobacteria bacterium]|nr:VanZ family protein [Deltaproteobacteria bacterium]